MENNMLLNYDPKSDVIYIATKKGIEEDFKKVAPGVNVELNKNGEVIGIEILRASRFFKPVAKQLLKRIH